MTARAADTARAVIKIPKRLRSASAATAEMPARMSAHQSALGNRMATKVWTFW